MEFDRIHFYVEDATASRDWFVRCLGFQSVASGRSDRTRTEVVKSGSVYFLLSSPLAPSSPVAQFLQQHPAGVADVAFRVRNLEAVLDKALAAGAELLQPVQQQQLPGGGYLKGAKISGWGDLTHTFIERSPLSFSQSDYGSFLMGDLFLSADSHSLTFLTQEREQITTFTQIDHAVLNVAVGDLNPAIAWYENTLGFQPQQGFAIQTEQSGLSSRVLVHPEGGAQLPINEPTSPNSQVQEFLDVNRGSGIQHIALRTENIVQAVQNLQQKGLPFLNVPATYYTQARDRMGTQLSAAEWQEIEKLRILVDWQEGMPEALLLQIFTQPILNEPTFFFEVIERRSQARGFGEGNFRALFEAIEREQLKRGSLSRS